MDTLEAVEDLISQLVSITPEKMQDFLKQQSFRWEREHWNCLFYELEELAELGHCKQAMALAAICQQYVTHASDSWLQRTIRYFTGKVHRHCGEFENALLCHQQVVSDGLAAGDEDGLAQALIAIHSIARIYMELGRTEDAIIALQQSIVLDEQRESVDDLLLDQVSLAGAYLMQEQFDDAERLLIQALERAETANRPDIQALTLNRLASLRDDLYNSATALELYNRAEEVLFEADAPDDPDLFFRIYQDTLTSRAMVYEDLQAFENAIADYSEASRIAHLLGDTRLQSTAITWLGITQLETDQPSHRTVW